jgi:hypothetical protein
VYGKTALQIVTRDDRPAAPDLPDDLEVTQTLSLGAHELTSPERRDIQVSATHTRTRILRKPYSGVKQHP